MKGTDKDKRKGIPHPDANDVTSPGMVNQYDPDRTQINGAPDESNHDAQTQMDWNGGQAGAADNPDRTVIRNPASQETGSVIRGQDGQPLTPAQIPQGNDSPQGHQPQNPDATVMRQPPQQPSSPDAAGMRQPPQQQRPQQPPQQPTSSPDSTVMRPQQQQAQNPNATVMRPQPQNPDATVMRPAQAGHQGEMDSTRINPDAGQARPDATRISPRKPVPPQRPAGQQTRTNVQHQPPQPSASQPITANSISPMPSAPVDPNKPRVLKNRFLLEKVLGVGGMGIVYKAKDRLKVEAQDRDPYVAIKVLNEEFKRHPESFIALQRESRKSQRMTHSNTVKVYDFDRDGDDVFMTMEYLEGKPLDTLLRQYSTTGLPHDDVWMIVEGMCSALAYAHEQGIVHSDFKPGNVFVTTDGIAKIFDFGIARAVANVERHDGKAEDKTVFDAGSLGALTPAYASLEMLQGKTPDFRDDIYALGCVIYELFTGKHPFGKMPADEAMEKGLKPQKIDGISKRQWRAVEQSLAFKRSDRTETVGELFKELTVKFKFSYVAAASGVVIAALLGVIYYLSTIQQPTVDVNDIVYKTKIESYRDDITRLIEQPTFTTDWQANLWREVKELSEYMQEADTEAWLADTKTTVYKMYVERINGKLKVKEFKTTEILITNAANYTEDASLLDHLKSKLGEAIRIAEFERKQRQVAKVTQQKEIKDKYDAFNVAHGNVTRQLRCQGRLDMRDFAIAVRKLRELDNSRYVKLEKGIVRQLSACIIETGKSFPERAHEAKKSAMRLFKSNPAIGRIKITARDACDISIAGLGASGSRTVCRDKIRGIGTGPAMVVIPGSRNIKPFAIGKYEISVDELNLYCKHSKKCKVNSNVQKYMPATNITVRTAKKYLRWLSDKTGQKYRLPSDDEWLHAANSRRRTLDSNRNCTMNSHGIVKGKELVKISTGRQNGWGLVNHVGNAREWVYGNGRKLIAVGGSYKDSMDVCTTKSRETHNGKPDKYTGFRVIRELRDTRT